jgi:hypothetical protein
MGDELVPSISRLPRPPSTATSLQARAGLLRDYDTLVKAVVTMEDAVTRLRSYAQTDGLTPAPGQRLNSARRLRAACARPTSYNRNTITDS